MNSPYVLRPHRNLVFNFPKRLTILLSPTGGIFDESQPLSSLPSRLISLRFTTPSATASGNRRKPSTTPFLPSSIPMLYFFLFSRLPLVSFHLLLSRGAIDDDRVLIENSKGSSQRNGSNARISSDRSEEARAARGGREGSIGT